ncbi:hypothetical protein F511_38005 [Dorcoceras hygrometricum]|uniref:Uncharacterized protein n=1 Tax=Dorcoceras hygrometricum TaxID=472368 RepID=A0A2Z7B0I9_9LAMI|nr:hypothetical protein F511_38005 [Dorcoceras hygrometricum]
MGNTDPNKTKAGNKYEVKPQYEELSKQINMQHAKNQCYECMRLSKEIGQLGQCINRQNISSRLYTTVYQPRNHRSVIIGARQPITARRLGLRDAGIDQLNFHSAQLGYLEHLQMGNTDPNKTKAGNKYEVKPQYEELSKQINMQHAKNQCYECMRLSKEIGQLGQCINRQNISSRLYTTVYQPGNHRSVIIGARQPITALRYYPQEKQSSINKKAHPKDGNARRNLLLNSAASRSRPSSKQPPRLVLVQEETPCFSAQKPEVVQATKDRSAEIPRAATSTTQVSYQDKQQTSCPICNKKHIGQSELVIMCATSVVPQVTLQEMSLAKTDYNQQSMHDVG